MARNIALIVSYADDPHALIAQKRILTITNGRVKPILFDSRTFPRSGSLSIDVQHATLRYSDPLPQLYAPERLNETLSTKDLKRISQHELLSVWWRRAGHSVPFKSTNTVLERHSALLSRKTLCATFRLLDEETLVVNPPHWEELADDKLYQLRIAHKLGLMPPNYLVSNDPEDVVHFCESNARDGKGTIYKQSGEAFGSGTFTRRLEDSDYSRFFQIRHCPAIFQEEIIGRDIRVTAVGDVVFCMEACKSNNDIVDVRVSQINSYNPIEMPNEVKNKFLGLLSFLKIKFCTADFIIDQNGSWRFLEVNVSGQWLYQEVLAQQPIAETLAAMLCKKETAHYEPVLPIVKEDEIEAVLGVFEERQVIERAVSSDNLIRVHNSSHISS